MGVWLELAGKNKRGGKKKKRAKKTKKKQKKTRSSVLMAASQGWRQWPLRDKLLVERRRAGGGQCEVY